MSGWRELVTALLFVLLGIADLSGQVTWRRSFGGFGSDVGKSVRVTSDGNYIVCGSTGSFGAGGGDIYLALLDPNGELIWSKTYGGPGVEQGNCVRQTTDGGFIIAGLTNSYGAGGYDGYLVRTEQDGTLRWARTYGGSDWDELHSIEEGSNNEFVAAGRTYSSGLGSSDGWLLRIQEDGTLDWERAFGSSGNDFLRDVGVVDGGGYVVAGGTDSTGNMDAWVMTVDIAGSLIWSAIDGGDSLDFGVDVVQTIDGGFSVIGTTESYSPWTEMYHYKLDAAGSFQWFNHWGQTGNQEGYEHLELSDGRLVSICYNRAVGNGGADFFLLFTDAQGYFILAPSYGGTEDDLGYSVASTPDGGFVMVGTTDSWGFGVQDIWVVKTDSMGQTASVTVVEMFDPLAVAESQSSSDIQLWPTPVCASAEVRLATTFSFRSIELFDAFGRQQFREACAPSTEAIVPLGGLSLSAGVYTVVLSGEGWKRSSKLIVIAP